jgi:hypothetical protein
MTDINYTKHVYKPNSMLPAPKAKRSPIQLHYLEDRRRTNGGIVDREDIKYKPYKWKKEMKHISTLDKFDYVFEKAQQISANEDMAEQYIR